MPSEVLTHIASDETLQLMLTELRRITAMQGPAGPAGPSYTLPAATTQALGGVKVGNGLTISNDGTLSVSFQNGDTIQY